jgi:predicted ATPase
LRVHISLLRRLLGRGSTGGSYISNVTGRGYRFVEPLVEVPEDHGSAAPSNTGDLNVRRPAHRLVGREAAVRTLCESLPARRFVTITGPGGIGKTTLALAVAAQVTERYRDGIHFIDLTALADPALLVQKVATSLQVHGVPTASEADLVSSIQDRQMLITLDNCEHLVEAVAFLSERMLSVAPDLHVLTTSREPLRAACEWVHRLPPLDLPPPVSPHNAAEILNSSSVILFLERARAGNDAFELSVRPGSYRGFRVG